MPGKEGFTLRLLTHQAKRDLDKKNDNNDYDENGCHHCNDDNGENDNDDDKYGDGDDDKEKDDDKHADDYMMSMMPKIAPGKPRHCPSPALPAPLQWTKVKSSE